MTCDESYAPAARDERKARIYKADLRSKVKIHRVLRRFALFEASTGIENQRVYVAEFLADSANH